LTRKVVVSLLTADQEFQQMQAADARAAAARLGLEIELVYAENNAIQQIHQLYKHIHAPEEQRPAAIVIEAVSRDGMERLARNALKAGIMWVAQEWKNPYLERLRGENPGAAVHSVCVDEEEIGRIQAQQLRALRPRGGSALLLQGPADSDAAAGRLKGLEQGLNGSGIVLKAVLNGDWTSESGARAVASWLRLRTVESVEIDVVGSQNDSMAAGARKALQQLRPEWGRLPFLGCDGLVSGGRQMVAQGELAATIVKPTTTGPAVELIARKLKGERIPLDFVLRAQSHPPLERIREGTGTPRP
jgi:ABC-type sugar transport system substrate-binding protein